MLNKICSFYLDTHTDIYIHPLLSSGIPDLNLESPDFPDPFFPNHLSSTLQKASHNCLCGHPTTFKFYPNPYNKPFLWPRSAHQQHNLPLGGCTRGEGPYQPWKQAGATSTGNYSVLVLGEWPTAGARALNGHFPSAPGTLALWEGYHQRGPVLRPRSRPQLPSLKIVLKTRVP